MTKKRKKSIFTVSSFNGEIGVRAYYAQSLEEAEKDSSGRSFTVKLTLTTRINTTLRFPAGGFYVSPAVDDNGNPVQREFSISFSYVIRGVLEGEYIGEPCVVFRNTDGAAGFSNRTVFTFGSDGKLKTMRPYVD